MNKHTPGPWESDNEFGTSITSGELTVAVVLNPINATKRQHPVPVGHDELRANARLITAAPELLDALRQALRELVAVHGEPCGANLESKAGTDAIHAARAALAKAEG